MLSSTVFMFFFLFVNLVKQNGWLVVGCCYNITVDCWQSVFLSIFNLKENGTRHGRGTPSSPLGHTTLSRLLLYTMTKRSS